jgi:tRNA nucleotidyltransferase (CCA-adding enzyme)
MSSLPEKLLEAHPELGAVARAAGDPVYAVGGAVRDLLLGRPPGDVDLVVEGDPGALAGALGAEPVAAHPEFGTLKLELGGREVDIAAARTESYARPGALPAVDRGATLEVDLARRDFTINTMAIPLRNGAELIDRHGGHDDLGRGLVRVLHPDSFVDDPTRALRAARYAARLGFELEPETEVLLRRTDLSTVSPERRAAELRKLAAEPSAPQGFALLAGWGLVEPRPGGIELAARVLELLAPSAPGGDAGASRGGEGTPPVPGGDTGGSVGRGGGAASPVRELWREQVAAGDVVLAAALGPGGREAELAAARPEWPSEAVDLARGHDAIELVLARALGAEWLDRYLAEWRPVRLEIDGSDLIAAGVEVGPGIGRGLAAALAAKLDNGPAGREAELAAALRAARTP